MQDIFGYFLSYMQDTFGVILSCMEDTLLFSPKKSSKSLVLFPTFHYLYTKLKM